ncbi:MAG TPA: hypothetical protein VK194_05655 [Candidatus Deferrimicrobium sp.]|nr:hypothetical protein [Candidatus Deferrimicrobium sp.]
MRTYRFGRVYNNAVCAVVGDDHFVDFDVDATDVKAPYHVGVERRVSAAVGFER